MPWCTILYTSQSLHKTVACSTAATKPDRITQFFLQIFSQQSQAILLKEFPRHASSVGPQQACRATGGCWWPGRSSDMGPMWAKNMTVQAYVTKICTEYWPWCSGRLSGSELPNCSLGQRPSCHKRSMKATATFCKGHLHQPALMSGHHANSGRTKKSNIQTSIRKAPLSPSQHTYTRIIFTMKFSNIHKFCNRQ